MKADISRGVALGQSLRAEMTGALLLFFVIGWGDASVHRRPRHTLRRGVMAYGAPEVCGGVPLRAGGLQPQNTEQPYKFTLW